MTELLLPEFVVGIDPGKQGAIGKLEHFGVVPEFWDTPLKSIIQNKKTKEKMDLAAVREIMRGLKSQGRMKVYLEHIWASRSGLGESGGIVSNEALLENFGSWEGILTALEIDYELVAPLRWQNRLSLRDIDADTTKKRSIIRAAQIFPTAQFIKPRCRTPSDGRCDAANIAYYGWLQTYGTNEPLTTKRKRKHG